LGCAYYKMMSTNIQTKNTTVPNSPSTQILLAESDLLEVDRIRSHIDREFQSRIKIVKNYNELLLDIVQIPPQIIILGRIDKLNYFEVCQACHKIWPELPIVLISRQEIANYSFRQLIKSHGITEIISKDFIKLNELLQALDLQQLTNKPQKTIVTGKMMLIGLEEIVAISNNYFGPLAQGNYWRKAHTCTANEFPSLLNWSADHFSKLGCNDNILEQELTDEDIQGVQTWVGFFVKECERIIIDFRMILNNSNLSPLAKDILDQIS
jgi:CheY-like chemotaxis protein